MKYLVIALLVIASLALVWKLNSNPDASADRQLQNEEQHPEPKNEEHAPVVRGAEKNIGDTEPSRPASEILSQELTPAQMQEFRRQYDETAEWHRQHGYFTGFNHYAGLTEEDLIPLANSGDLQALHTLGERHTIKEPFEAIDYLMRAAAFGSTYALGVVSGVYEFHSLRNEALNIQPEEFKDADLHAIAYSFAAQRMGDNSGAGLIASTYLTTEFVANPEKIEAACKLTSEIVADIDRTRVEIGVPEIEIKQRSHSVPIKEQGSVSFHCGNN